MEKTNEELNKMVDQHWKYTSKIMELMYKEAMVHGYKHAIEDLK